MRVCVRLLFKWSSFALKSTRLHPQLHTCTADRCSFIKVQFSFVHMANSLTFSHRVSNSPSPWPLAFLPPISTHSFLLAALCQTPAITSTLPTRRHGSVTGRCWAGSPFWPMADQSQVVMRCDHPTVVWLTSWGRYWNEGVNATQQRQTTAHTTQAPPAAQSIWGPSPQAVRADVMYHLCYHCVAFYWNMLTEALLWLLTDSHTFTGF